MNDDEIEKVLKDVCSELGAGVSDGSRVRGLLADRLSSEHHGKIPLLMTIHRFGVLEKFANIKKNDKAEVRLQEKKFLQEVLIAKAYLEATAATWGLSAWLHALGFPDSNVSVSEPENKNTPPKKTTTPVQPAPATPSHGQATTSPPPPPPPAAALAPRSMLASLWGTIVLLIVTAAILLFLYLDPLQKASLATDNQSTDDPFGQPTEE